MHEQGAELPSLCPKSDRQAIGGLLSQSADCDGLPPTNGAIGRLQERGLLASRTERSDRTLLAMVSNLKPLPCTLPWEPHQLCEYRAEHGGPERRPCATGPNTDFRPWPAGFGRTPCY